jgi:hypothetical protein
MDSLNFEADPDSQSNHILARPVSVIDPSWFMIKGK